MDNPAELFDNFFKTRPAKDQATYRGRDDLAGYPDIMSTQLQTFQAGFQHGLDTEKKGVAEHVSHPPFHIDYVDADIANAIAFRYCDWSFIGVTVPLIDRLARHAEILSLSQAITEILGLPGQTDRLNPLQAGLFNFALQFVITHEYVHHVFGHVEDSWNGPFFIEVPTTVVLGGSIGSQAKEVTADGYGMYHVLSNAFDASRCHAIENLGIREKDVGSQDKILLMAIVIAVGAFVLNRSVPELTLSEVVWASHPPPVVRMNFIIENVISYLSASGRNELAAFMDRSMSGRLMNAVLDAVADSNTNYTRQISFWDSSEASRYIAGLRTGVYLERAQLGSRS